MFKILINADPNPDFQEVVALLRKTGFELEELSQQQDQQRSYQALVEKTKSAHPDLLLLSPDMAHSNNFSLCKQLKNNPQTESIPVVFISCARQAELQTSNRQTHIVEGLECGAYDVIHAPSQNKELLARIQAAIRTKMHMNKSKALTEQLNQMNSELYERNLAIEKELYTTRQLQQSLLPPILTEEASNANNSDVGQSMLSKCHYKNSHLKISGVYLPCDALGGDLYDVIQFADKSVGVAIADVSGHGVPAAFVTAIFKASFYRTTHNFTKPGDVFHHLNNELINIIKTGQYVTGVYNRLSEKEPGHYTMEFSGAGHPYPFYYCARTNAVERLDANSTPLAWFKDMEYPTGEISLQAGDKVLLFSDGISEMKNAHDAMYGEDALGKVFEEIIASNSPTLLDDLLGCLSDFTEGHPLDDDVSVVLIEVS